MSDSTDNLIFFNGVTPDGAYLLPPLSADAWANIASGLPFDASPTTPRGKTSLGLAEGIDAKDLAQTGWGVIFAADADPKIQDALQELLTWRQAQANANAPHERFHIYSGANGYQANDTPRAFLDRLGILPGPVNPDQVPYYLLIVGDPEKIPYSFQSQLDAAYAVGRIHFDSPDDYARYAHSVVQAEKQNLMLPRRAIFFAPANDTHTQQSVDYLVKPLAEQMQNDQSAFAMQTIAGADATKTRLNGLLGGAETPAFLFTASHGLGFELGDPRQLKQQGALICQDWGGPDKPCTPDTFFSAADISADAKLWGLIAFHFACFGAGTPKLDEYAQLHQGVTQRAQIAPNAFVANLPKRLLAHPNGGALAVIGHIDRAWGNSFYTKAGTHVEVYKSTLKRLMEGHPVGSAMDYFGQRYGQLAITLSDELQSIKYGENQYDPAQVVSDWTANNDARGFAVIGDPAVRLLVSDNAPMSRPMLS